MPPNSTPSPGDAPSPEQPASASPSSATFPWKPGSLVLQRDPTPITNLFRWLTDEWKLRRKKSGQPSSWAALADRISAASDVLLSPAPQHLSQWSTGTRQGLQLQTVLFLAGELGLAVRFDPCTDLASVVPSQAPGAEAYWQAREREQEERERLLAEPLSSLGLPSRIEELLQEAGIQSLRTLCEERTRPDVLGISGLGRGSAGLRVLEEALAGRGLLLRED